MLMHVSGVCLFGNYQDLHSEAGQGRGVTQILPFPRISEIKSFIIFFLPLQMLSTDV